MCLVACVLLALPKCVCEDMMYYVFTTCRIYLLVIPNLMVALFTHSFTLGMIRMIHWIFVPFAKASSELPDMDGDQNYNLTTPQRFSVAHSPTLDNETETTAPNVTVRKTQNWASKVPLVGKIKLQDTSSWRFYWSTSSHKKQKQNKQKQRTFRVLLLKTFSLKSKAILFFHSSFGFNIQWRPGGKTTSR